MPTVTHYVNTATGGPRRNIVPFLKTPAHAALLASVLQESDNEALLGVAEQIRDATQFAVPEFDDHCDGQPAEQRAYWG